VKVARAQNFTDAGRKPRSPIETGIQAGAVSPAVATSPEASAVPVIPPAPDIAVGNMTPGITREQPKNGRGNPRNPRSRQT
jgi:hypothetical protein